MVVSQGVCAANRYDWKDGMAELQWDQLPRLGLLGIQSLDFIDSHKAPSAAWTGEQATLLKTAADHSELTDFVIIPPLQQLLDAADKH